VQLRIDLVQRSQMLNTSRRGTEGQWNLDTRTRLFEVLMVVEICGSGNKVMGMLFRAVHTEQGVSRNHVPC
jgi:hypothetical protein